MIATPQNVRDIGNFPVTLKDEQILPHLRVAEQRLRRWVGTAVYEAAEADAGEYAVAQTQALEDAEALLAISIGLRSWNLVMESGGGTAAGITDRGTIGGGAEYQYLSQGALDKAELAFLRKAEEAARDWLADSSGGGVPGPGISYALDDERVSIDHNYENE